MREDLEGWGVTARVSASGDVSDSAASSRPGVGVAGSSLCQESLVLAAPSSIASSASAERDHQSTEGLLRTAPALHDLPHEGEILVKSVIVPVCGLGGRVTGLASHVLNPRTVRGLVDEGPLAGIRHAPLLPMCGLGGPGRGLRTATSTVKFSHAL